MNILGFVVLVVLLYVTSEAKYNYTGQSLTPRFQSPIVNIFPLCFYFFKKRKKKKKMQNRAQQDAGSSQAILKRERNKSTCSARRKWSAEEVEGEKGWDFFPLPFLSFDLRVGIPLEELLLCCVQSTRSVTQPADNGCSPPLITRSHQSGTSACIFPVVSQVNYSSAVPDSLMFFPCPPAPFLLCPSFFCLLLLLFFYI